MKWEIKERYAIQKYLAHIVLHGSYLLEALLPLPSLTAQFSILHSPPQPYPFPPLSPPHLNLCGEVLAGNEREGTARRGPDRQRTRPTAPLAMERRRRGQ